VVNFGLGTNIKPKLITVIDRKINFFFYRIMNIAGYLHMRAIYSIRYHIYKTKNTFYVVINNELLIINMPIIYRHNNNITITLSKKADYHEFVQECDYTIYFYK
jgi:hypothetical protein